MVHPAAVTVSVVKPLSAAVAGLPTEQAPVGPSDSGAPGGGLTSYVLAPWRIDLPDCKEGSFLAEP